MCITRIASALILATSIYFPAFASTINVSATATSSPMMDSHSASGVTSASTSASQAFPTDGADASASGTAGMLHLSADAHSGGGGNLGAQANASWSDRFYISAPGVADGTLGYFTATITVEGSLSSTISGRSYADSEIYADLRLDALTNPLNGAVATLRAHGEGQDMNGYDTGERINGSSGIFVLQIVDMPFLFGRPIDEVLSGLASASLNTNGGSGGEATADYGNTLIWSGITGLRDASGNAITDFTAISPTSGFDFAAPMATAAVPEPGVVLLLFGGTLGMAVFRRRRSPESVLGR